MDIQEELEKLNTDYLDCLAKGTDPEDDAVCGSKMHSHLQNILLIVEDKHLLILEPGEIGIKMSREIAKDMKRDTYEDKFCDAYDYIQDQLKKQLEEK